MIEQTDNRSKWNQDSILIKLGFIIVLILLLLIPTTWIQSLISDREDYNQQNISQVANQWAGSQLVEGPVLALPYMKVVTESNSSGKPVTHPVQQTLYVLPQTLQYKAKVGSQDFAKSVYDVIVYDSDITGNGSFAIPDFSAADVDPATILYDKAKLFFNVTDLKGLKDNPVVVINGQSYNAEPVNSGQGPFNGGFRVNFPLQGGRGMNFSFQLGLKGSNELSFLDIAKTTSAEVTSDWEHADFSGRYLPDMRKKDGKSFNFKWQMMNYSRPFPQQWTGADSVLTNKKAVQNASFGLKIQKPVDQYRKVMRTAKYAILIILLTFVSLFLTELIKKQRVHLFNYTLIGAAMAVYYTLLLSFSEQIGFDWAYLVSSVSTISLIAWFIASLLKNRSMAFLFASILSVFYGFIFIIIQLEELSLLFGSVALFIIIAVLMYFSRKINWDKQQ